MEKFGLFNFLKTPFPANPLSRGLSATAQSAADRTNASQKNTFRKSHEPPTVASDSGDAEKEKTARRETACAEYGRDAISQSENAYSDFIKRQEALSKKIKNTVRGDSNFPSPIPASPKKTPPRR